MSNYTGVPCSHCEQPFSKDDDIVVCPSCGAPHHRRCYRELGRCAHEAEHSSGFEWMPPAGAPNPADGQPTACPSCGAGNAPSANFCQSCGRRLDAQAPPADAPPAFSASSSSAQNRYRAAVQSLPQWEVNGVSAREISAYVGNGAFYFLRQFQMLLRSKSNISWNWPAFFFKYAYFFYRKLYLRGALVLGFYLFTSIPLMQYSIELFKAEYAPQFFGIVVPYNHELMAQLTTMAPFISMLRFIMALFCGLYANKLFLHKTLSDIQKTRAVLADGVQDREYYNVLSVQGRPNRVVIVGLVAAYLLGYAYFTSYLALAIGLV